MFTCCLFVSFDKNSAMCRKQGSSQFHCNRMGWKMCLQSVRIFFKSFLILHPRNSSAGMFGAMTQFDADLNVSEIMLSENV